MKSIEELKREKARVFLAMCEKLEEAEVTEKMTQNAEKTLRVAKLERNIFREEFEKMEDTLRLSEKVWRDFEDYREHTSSIIEVKAIYLKREKRQIREFKEGAKLARKNGNNEEADRLEEEKRKHERKRDALSSSLINLQERIRRERRIAEKNIMRSAEYNAKKTKYEEAEVRYALAEREYEQKKETSDLFRAEYRLLCKEYDVVKKELEKALANQ